MTRIGIVCEGPTDFIAISEFLAASLRARGVEAEFIDVQPALDATSLVAGGGGGWPNALAWLENNPLASRLAAYLGVGLFASGLSSKKCDYLVVQIDTDVLDEEHFSNFVTKRKPITVAKPVSPADRFDEVKKVLLAFCEFANSADADASRHIVAPAVENTEAWCVAARDPQVVNLESMRKTALASAFEVRLVGFEGGTAKPGSIKSVGRRLSYCQHHRAAFGRVETECSQYLRLVQEVERVLAI